MSYDGLELGAVGRQSETVICLHYRCTVDTSCIDEGTTAILAKPPGCSTIAAGHVLTDARPLLASFQDYCRADVRAPARACSCAALSPRSATSAPAPCSSYE